MRTIISMDDMLKIILLQKQSKMLTGFLMQHKFPVVSLRMEMEGNDLDVNVHRQKRGTICERTGSLRCSL